MTSQAPERTHPEPVNREERRVQVFASMFREIRAMDLEADTLRALLDCDPAETEPTEEQTAAARPD
jgi:hypothetical protein